MGLMLLIVVALVCAAAVFTVLDRNGPGRTAAIVGATVTFLVGALLPFGMIIAILAAVGVFAWAMSRTSQKSNY